MGQPWHCGRYGAGLRSAVSVKSGSAQPQSSALYAGIFCFAAGFRQCYHAGSHKRSVYALRWFGRIARLDNRWREYVSAVSVFERSAFYAAGRNIRLWDAAGAEEKEFAAKKLVIKEFVVKATFIFGRNCFTAAFVVK